MKTSAVPSGTIVVGVDGSVGGDRALSWAVAQATLESRPLTLALGLADRWTEMEPADLARLTAADDIERADARSVLHEARRRVTDLAPELALHEVMSVGRPQDFLVELSERAVLVVVGSRGRGPVRSTLLGSVGVALCHRAACPVVVVRRGHPGLVRHGVLVGTDATGGSGATVELAYRQASVHGLPLTILHCGDRVRSADDDEALRLALAEVVSGLAEKFPDVRATTEIAEGPSDKVLAERSDRMNLVVVGAGSGSAAVVEHAGCPVAVVPARTDQGG
ncbi:universal stress protein [Nocardioides sp. URHA0020]|uniref:universal stress protein n=1 Tax=Nocardioides sp. URHA0020 TaxID=1380392 RepID=UPI000491412E|nr:universal stress protein [Nocardioides sp. URHA0020]